MWRNKERENCELPVRNNASNQRTWSTLKFCEGKTSTQNSLPIGNIFRKQRVSFRGIKLKGFLTGTHKLHEMLRGVIRAEGEGFQTDPRTGTRRKQRRTPGEAGARARTGTCLLFEPLYKMIEYGEQKQSLIVGFITHLGAKRMRGIEKEGRKKWDCTLMKFSRSPRSGIIAFESRSGSVKAEY